MSGVFGIRSALARVAANAGWLFLLRFIRLAFAFFVGVWMARYLGPELWGTLNYAIALVILFGPLTRLGLEGVVVHELVKRPQDRDAILGTSFALRVAGGALSMAATIALVAILRPGDSLSMLLVAIISFGWIFQAYDAIDVFFQAEERLKYPVYAKSVGLVVSNLLKIYFILTNAPLPAFAAAASLEILVASAGLAVAYRAKGFRMRSWTVRRGEIKRLFNLGWPMMLSSAFAVVYLKIDLVMLGQMIDQAEVGIYSTAARISEMWYFVPVAISTAIFPSLIQSRIRLGRDVYVARTQRLYDFFVWVSLAIAVGVAFAAEFIVVLLFGEEYARAGGILAIHVWAGVFIFLREALGRWFITEDLLSFAFISNGLGALVNVLLNLVLIPRYAATGAAVATVISYASAGYFACFVHPKTREAAWMMSRALAVPVRALAALLRRLGTGNGK